MCLCLGAVLKFENLIWGTHLWAVANEGSLQCYLNKIQITEEILRCRIAGLVENPSNRLFYLKFNEQKISKN